MQRPKRLSLYALILLTALALALRLSNTHHMLPHNAEPDAFIVDQAEILRRGSPEALTQSFVYSKYPHLLARLLMLAPAPEFLASTYGAEELPSRLETVSEPYLNGRRLSALLAVLLIPATWLLARRFFGVWEALFAAALIATSLLHLNFSWQARPHAALATFTTLALLGCLRLRRAPTAGNYLLAGGLVALAVCCLHNGTLVLPAALAAHLLSAKPEGKRRNHLLLLLPLALLALAVRVFYPFLFEVATGAATSPTIGAGGIAQAGHRVNWAALNGSGFAVLWRDLNGHDPTLLFLGLIGVAAFLVTLRRGVRSMDSALKRDVLVVLVCFVPYFIVLGINGRSVERYQVPLLPFYALAAVVALRALASGLRRMLPGAPYRPRIQAVLALAILALPTFAAVRLASLGNRPDTAEAAVAWITENLSPETERILVRLKTALPVGAKDSGLPVVPERVVEHPQPWQKFLMYNDMKGPGAWQLVSIPWRIMLFTGQLRPSELRGPASDRRFGQMLEELGAEWVLLERNMFGEPPRTVGRRIDERGEVVARFAPNGTWEAAEGNIPPRWIPLGRGYQWEPLLQRALFCERWGPTYDLVRLGPRR